MKSHLTHSDDCTVLLSISETFTEWFCHTDRKQWLKNQQNRSRTPGSRHIRHSIETLISRAAAKDCVAVTREWPSVAFAGPRSWQECCYASMRGLVACIDRVGELWRRRCAAAAAGVGVDCQLFDTSRRTCWGSLNHHTHQCYFQQSRHVHARPTYNIQRVSIGEWVILSWRNQAILQSTRHAAQLSAWTVNCWLLFWTNWWYSTSK